MFTLDKAREIEEIVKSKAVIHKSDGGEMFIGIPLEKTTYWIKLPLTNNNPGV